MVSSSSSEHSNLSQGDCNILKPNVLVSPSVDQGKIMVAKYKIES